MTSLFHPTARVLVIAPHPDDEVIGCAGLMQRVKEAGGSLYVQYMTVGDTKEWSAAGQSGCAERLREVEQVVERLRVDDYHIAYRGNAFHLKLDCAPQLSIVDLLESSSPLSLTSLRPTAVIIPSMTSYNQDHRAVAAAAMTALRPIVADLRHNPTTVLAFEQLADSWTPSATVPNPSLHVELDEAHLDAKIGAMELYASQCRESPHTRSSDAMRALATLRGCQTGVRFAEAFHCLRHNVTVATS